jgi:hypothetical protein
MQLKAAPATPTATTSATATQCPNFFAIGSNLNERAGKDEK